MQRVRISMLPLMSACGGALAASDGLEMPDTTAMSVGRKVSHAITQAVLGKSIDVAMAEAKIDGYELLDAVAALYDQVSDLINCSVPIKELRIEVPVSCGDGDIELVGDPDLVVICAPRGEDEVLLYDLRSGYSADTVKLAVDQARICAALLVRSGAAVRARAYVADLASKQLHLACDISRDAACEVLDGAISIVRRARGMAGIREVDAATHCRYCPAFGTPRCPESVRMVIDSLHKVRSVMSKYRTEHIPLDELASLYDQLEWAEQAKCKLLAYIRNLLKQGTRVDGFALSSPIRRVEVTDVGRAISLLREYFADEELATAMSMSVALLSQVVKRKKSQLGITQASRAWLEELLHKHGLLKETVSPSRAKRVSVKSS